MVIIFVSFSHTHTNNYPHPSWFAPTASNGANCHKCTRNYLKFLTELRNKIWKYDKFEINIKYFPETSLIYLVWHFIHWSGRLCLRNVRKYEKCDSIFCSNLHSPCTSSNESTNQWMHDSANQTTNQSVGLCVCVVLYFRAYCIFSFSSTRVEYKSLYTFSDICYF